ncbi:ferredoxin [Actinomadura sp. WAC 06369]|uniref:ferredoxin n=1 Tax=Actinomadura sp. WAC 06369 TaxID=2203193 RepID=UPI0018F52500|nr:ferredoxin [Actinomadura sp. WAC 06369]
MKLYADPKTCVGAGLCVLRLPDVFDQDEDDGTVILLRTTPDPAQESTVLNAVKACPTGALRVDR